MKSSRGFPHLNRIHRIVSDLRSLKKKKKSMTVMGYIHVPPFSSHTEHGKSWKIMEVMIKSWNNCHPEIKYTYWGTNVSIPELCSFGVNMGRPNIQLIPALPEIQISTMSRRHGWRLMNQRHLRSFSLVQLLHENEVASLLINPAASQGKFMGYPGYPL